MNNIIKSGDDYFIIEKIVPNAIVSLPFSATSYQIYRVVYNVSSEHELYIDDERVDSLSPTFKQKLKYILEYEPTSKETKNKISFCWLLHITYRHAEVRNNTHSGHFKKTKNPCLRDIKLWR